MFSFLLSKCFKHFWFAHKNQPITALMVDLFFLFLYSVYLWKTMNTFRLYITSDVLSYAYMSCYFVSLFPANIPSILPVLLGVEPVSRAPHRAEPDDRLVGLSSPGQTGRGTCVFLPPHLCRCVCAGVLVSEVCGCWAETACALSLLREAFYGMQRDRSPASTVAPSPKTMGVTSWENC